MSWHLVTAPLGLPHFGDTMMEVKKHYQGQKGATPRSVCPVCGEILQKAYVRKSVNGKRAYVDVGLSCPSETCDYIKKFKTE